MKPFNLERALAGDPVVTRNGCKVLRIIHMPEVTKSACKIVAIVEQHGAVFPVLLWENGVFSHSDDHYHDLFMAPVKKEYWVNMYEQGRYRKYFSEEDADENGSVDRIGGKAHRIEVEE